MKILEAYQLTAQLLAGQVDKAGRPLIEHAVRVFIKVLDKGGSRFQQIAALLHDTIEDGRATQESLLKAGVPPESVRLIVTLTRPKSLSYGDYVDLVKLDPQAVAIKIEDIGDNADPERLALLEPETAARLSRKYSAALAVLRGETVPMDLASEDGESEAPMSRPEVRAI